MPWLTVSPSKRVTPRVRFWQRRLRGTARYCSGLHLAVMRLPRIGDRCDSVALNCPSSLKGHSRLTAAYRAPWDRHHSAQIGRVRSRASDTGHSQPASRARRPCLGGSCPAPMNGGAARSRQSWPSAQPRECSGDLNSYLGLISAATPRLEAGSHPRPTRCSRTSRALSKEKAAEWARLLSWIAPASPLSALSG